VTLPDSYPVCIENHLLWEQTPMNLSANSPASGFKRFWRRHYAVPLEHGAWIWWIGPLLAGAAAAGGIDAAFMPLSLAALTLFMVRQPIAVALRAITTPSKRSDLTPAFFWAVLYSAILLASLIALIAMGHARVLWLGFGGVPVFVWHLIRSRRKERRFRADLDIAAAAALALTAPAAYLVCGGGDSWTPWILWAMLSAAFSASILQVLVRLGQRQHPETIAHPWRDSAGYLTHHAINLAGAGVLAILGLAPLLAVPAFFLTLIEGIEGAWRPPVKRKTAYIGFRQLGLSTLFVLLLAAGYWQRTI
jgi:hypothetical protein